MGELERPRKVIRIAWLVGVDKDQVKWVETLGGELRQRIQRPPDAYLNNVR